MRSSIRVGRIAGVEVGVNWTWFLVFFLIAWSLAVGVFPEQNPGLPQGAYWAMGAIAAVLFFASILLHELGHAVQARRDQVEIEGITLWLFGGVARFKSLYGSPGAEFRIAIAGPLVTTAIAAVLIAFGNAAPLPTGVEGVVVWLGYINVLLLVFNLLPALPLDGGRLLHAALWRVKRDQAWATRVAAAIGAGFGFVMVGGGFALLLSGAGFGGLWIAVLGWFLSTAAGAEAQQMAARRALQGVKVGDLMARDPVTVERGTSVGRFVDDIARETHFTSYPVVEGTRPVGLVTFRCVADLPRERWDDERVDDCMLERDRVPVVRPDEDAAEALVGLAGGDVNRALVVEDDRLAGVLSISDLVRAVELGARRGGEDGSA